ncbi:polysaccharide lyase family 7 protein [Vibrio cyclitrophicus]|nr:polysaccharide lyase family 7 protein [Vibrio cyclitrophicus]UPR37255.1 polysaccharide lyase family 7 protein [Vibrio cyclitrophicus]UPR54956.1 polysaccharide lyase family 7 protein [Vibrio cyclitrophicus]
MKTSWFIDKVCSPFVLQTIFMFNYQQPLKYLKVAAFISSGLLLAGCEANAKSEQAELKTCTDCNWNIEQWKITLPVSGDDYYNNGRSSAAELIPQECNGKEYLTNDTHLPWFSRESVNGEERLKFTVDLGGQVSTTANTKYARSELRELYKFNTENRCSTKDQNWAVTGTHELKATVSVDQFPNKDVTGSDPKVVLGQIHGKDIKQALVKLQWDGENKPVRVVLNDSFLPGNKMCSDCQPFSVNLGVAPANLDWDYTIRLDEQGIYLSTLINDELSERFLPWGIETEDRDGNKVTLSKAWLEEEYYFKAGLYAQIKPSREFAGQVFSVSFSKINIDHR